MTASTATSNSSRMIEAPVEGESSREAVEGEVDRLGHELSADPVELLTTGIPHFEPSAIRGAREANRQPELHLQLCCQGPHRSTFAAAWAARPVGADPILRLPHRQ